MDKATFATEELKNEAVEAAEEVVKEKTATLETAREELTEAEEALQEAKDAEVMPE